MKLLNQSIDWFTSSGFEENIVSSVNFLLNLALRIKDDYKDVAIPKKPIILSTADLYYNFL
jgi:hypothetical protein